MKNQKSTAVPFMLTGIKETYSRKREIRQVRRNEKYPLSLMVKKTKFISGPHQGLFQ